MFSSVGVDADDEKVSMVVKELAGKNVEDLIKEGLEKVSSGPSAGGF